MTICREIKNSSIIRCVQQYYGVWCVYQDSPNYRNSLICTLMYTHVTLINKINQSKELTIYGLKVNIYDYNPFVKNRSTLHMRKH